MSIADLWWIFALFSGMGLAGRNILMKTANQAIDPALASMLLAISMAAASVGFLVLDRVSKKQAIIPPDVSWSGIAMAAIAGVSLAAANIFLSFSYRSGGSAGITSILQNGVSISLTLLIGVLLLHEVIKPMQLAGIGFAVIGVFMMIRG